MPVNILKIYALDYHNLSVLAFVRSFTYMAQGSAFFHGSETDVGAVADVKLNDLFTFIGYQAAVSGLEPLDSSILHDLSVTPRSKTAVETTAELQNVYINQPVETWKDAVNEIDVPRIYLGMCGYMIVAMSVFMEKDFLYDVVTLLVTILG